MQKQFKLTQERLDELKHELEYLKTVREKEVAEQIKEARSFGDLSENSEYDEAKNEQGKLYSRIAELDSILSNYTIIDDESITTAEVAHGCKVTVEFDDGEREEYQLVGSQEADPRKGRISDESPIGHAVVGKKVGETCIIEAPAGNLTCKVVAISK